MTELFQTRYHVFLHFKQVLHPPPVLLRFENSWTVILLTLHSFHVSDHLIDNIQPMLLLTKTFYHQPVSWFYSRFLYLYIYFGVCFPTCWLGHTILTIIANDVVLLCSNPRLKFCCPVIGKPQTVYLFSNPCRTIQINCFQLIFYLSTAFERFRLILLPNLFRHVWVNRSKSNDFILLQFQWIFYLLPVFLRVEDSWIVILLTLLSFPVPSFLVLVWLFEWKIVCLIAKPYAFFNLSTEILNGWLFLIILHLPIILLKNFRRDYF
jgi:hypothetical protein